MTVKRVGIVGSGIMGSGIAEVAAKTGHEVVLRSRKQETADSMVAGLEKSLAKQVEKGRLSDEDRQGTLQRVTATSDLGDLAACDLVIESIVEDLQTKKHLFTELDRICGESTLLATNTSTLPVIEMAMETGRPQKVCGVHFFNPAPMMSLVEIVRPLTADDETVAEVKAFAEACGKSPVDVKDQAGFVVNALLFPYLNNAVRLLEQGVASKEDIDTAMKGGCGFPMGPLALLDLVGLDTSLAILEALYEEFKEPNYSPVAHLGHMGQLMDGIPVGEMNTSMTINATAAWLLGLYIANATDQGVEPAALAGTTQNDIVKEYLSRGTYIFPPGPSRRLIVDMVAWTVRNAPKWNPINVCSYHLQEAGATPVQELAYALATAIGVLDAVRESGQVEARDFPAVVGRISFFCNAGIRFVEETCKMRAFTQLWDRICADRYGVDDPKLRRFRYGVQVNSLGLTEAQPENNVQRIVLETLGVTLSKDARARAIQLPCWNEALGLPRPWDQQWSLRIQQVLAFETDLLEYDDIFDGSHVVEAKVAELVTDARAEMDRVQAMGGAVAAVESGYMKSELVSSHSARRARIENGEDIV